MRDTERERGQGSPISSLSLSPPLSPLSCPRFNLFLSSPSFRITLPPALRSLSMRHNLSPRPSSHSIAHPLFSVVSCERRGGGEFGREIEGRESMSERISWAPDLSFLLLFPAHLPLPFLSLFLVPSRALSLSPSWFQFFTSRAHYLSVPLGKCRFVLLFDHARSPPSSPDRNSPYVVGGVLKLLGRFTHTLCSAQQRFFLLTVGYHGRAGARGPAGEPRSLTCQALAWRQQPHDGNPALWLSFDCLFRPWCLGLSVTRLLVFALKPQEQPLKIRAVRMRRH